AGMISGTLATVACLAEIRPLIPSSERAWSLVAEQEADALLRAGDLGPATGAVPAVHAQTKARPAAAPASTERQRDLSISHERLGDVAVAAGDLTPARTAQQADLEIGEGRG